MEPDKILIDVRTSEKTLSEVLAFIRDYQAGHPNEEVFLDGDVHAIVSRRRCA